MIDPPWEDHSEWHRMTRITGPDCAVMCNLINIHTYLHVYTCAYSGTGTHYVLFNMNEAVHICKY